MKVINKSKGVSKNIDLMAVAKQHNEARLRRMEEAGKSVDSDVGTDKSSIKKAKGFQSGFTTTPGAANPDATPNPGAASGLGTGSKTQAGHPTGGM